MASKFYSAHFVSSINRIMGCCCSSGLPRDDIAIDVQVSFIIIEKGKSVTTNNGCCDVIFTSKDMRWINTFCCGDPSNPNIVPYTDVSRVEWSNSFVYRGSDDDNRQLRNCIKLVMKDTTNIYVGSIDNSWLQTFQNTICK